MDSSGAVEIRNGVIGTGKKTIVHQEVFNP
jgi:hypothetical protein